MTPVNQTVNSGILGNCFEACLASIFDVPLLAIPQHQEWEGNSREGFLFYLQTLKDTFLLPRGCSYAEISNVTQFCPAGYHLIIGQVRSGSVHCVVGLEGKPVFDPHPEKPSEDWFQIKAFGLILKVME